MSRRMVTVALTLTALLPLWWFPRAATQDGPSHLYNTSVLLHWNEPGAPFADVFERDLTPVPNWLGTALLWLAMLALDPAAAEKTILTLCVAGMAAAWWFWVTSVRGAAGPLATMGPLLATGFFLFKGFHGFCLSVPVFLLAAGWAWRMRDRVTVGRAAGLHALLGLAWLAHVVSFGLALITSTLILLPVPARRGEGADRGVAEPRRREAWRRAALLSPALLLALSSLASVAEGSAGRRWGWGRILLYIARGEWLVFAGPWQTAVGCGVMLLLAVLAAGRLIALARDGKQASRTHSGSGGASNTGPRVREEAPGARPRATGAAHPLLIAAGMAWALCLLLPRAAGGGDFLTDRLAMYPVLLLAPLLDVPHGRARRQAAVMAAVAALTVAQAVFAWDYQQRANAQLEEYLSLPVGPANGSVLLPLAWEEPSAWRVSPLRHAGALYALRARAINLADYEAATGYFQVRFREPVARTARVPFVPPLHIVERDPSSLDVRPLAGFVDHLIAWNLRDGAPAGLMERYLERWEIAAEAGRVILFRRRQV